VGARLSAPTQTGPGAHPASYTTSNGSFPGVKLPGQGIDHPPTSSAEVKKDRAILYVQVTVHHDNRRINNQQDASNIQNFILSRNSTCFGHPLSPSSGVISCTRGNCYVSCRLCGRYLGESGWNCLFQPDSPRQRPHNLHET
jgi:hypothetical protein